MKKKTEIVQIKLKCGKTFDKKQTILLQIDHLS